MYLGSPELEVFRVALCEQVFLFRLVKERGFGVWPDTDALRREFCRRISLSIAMQSYNIFLEYASFRSLIFNEL